jgi:two-component system nitrate/nitrite response regulator NarL
MPAITGNEVLAQVRSQLPNQKFIILTMHDDRENVVAIADAGAEGYVLKSSDPKVFTEAIRRVNDGGTYYSSEVIHHLFKAVKKEKEVFNELKAFTDREIEILKLVLKEKTSHEIADELFISKQTVDTHRKNILHKSNEHSLIGLVKFGLRNGLLEIQD